MSEIGKLKFLNFSENKQSEPLHLLHLKCQSTRKFLMENEDDKPEIPAGVAWAVIVALAATGAFGYYKIKLEPERNERKVEESRVQEFMNPAYSNASSTIPMDMDDDPLNS